MTGNMDSGSDFRRETPKKASDSRSAERTRGSGLVILAGDGGDWEVGVAQALEAQGLVVCSVHRPLEAIRTARAAGAEAVLISADIGGDRGFDVCQCFLEDPDLRSIPIIMFSEEVCPESHLRALREGAVDFISKQIDPRVLVERVRMCLARAREMKGLKQKLWRHSGGSGSRSGTIPETSDRLEAVAEKEKRTEDELREAYARMEQLMGALPSILIGLDCEGRITHWNKVAEITFGFSSEKMVGRDLAHCSIPWDGLSVSKSIASCLRSGEPVRMAEIGFMRPTGLMGVLGLTLNPIKSCYGNVTAILIFGTDITERRALEEQLLHAQKMEAVGRLAGGVAHDFNNLLMIIMGHADLLLSRSHPEDETVRRIQEVRQCASRATSLTHQLLAFSRKQVIASKVLDLNTLVRDTEKMLHRLIGEDITLEVNLDADLGKIKADPGQVVQVIMNLAVNARDAMPRGGRLVLKTADVDLDRAYSDRHENVQVGSYVMLAVSDSGCGMDAATRAQLFEPFFTTKEVGKGTGLGLSTVYGMVKQSGGSILVYTEPGLGSTFKVYFPRVESRKRASQLTESFEASPSETDAIVVAEDEPGILLLVTDLLTAGGYKVISARDGAEALKKCAEYKGRIRLLVTDVVMPNVDGIELAQRLRDEHPDMQILYMSGHADPEAFASNQEKLPGIFLQKPFSTDAIKSSVKEILGD